MQHACCFYKREGFGGLHNAFPLRGDLLSLVNRVHSQKEEKTGKLEGIIFLLFIRHPATMHGELGQPHMADSSEGDV